MNDLQKLESHVLPDILIEDQELIIQIPATELKKAIYLRTPYKYKYSNNKQLLREAEEERIIDLFL